MSKLLITLPLPGAYTDMSTLQELRNVRGVIPGDILPYHAIDGFAQAFGGALLYVPSFGPRSKRWTETGWTETGKPDTYLTLDGFLDAWNATTWSHFSMEVYGRTIAGFYQDYAAARDATLRWIPRWIEINEPHPSQMNMMEDYGRSPGPRMVTSAESPYPLAKRAPGTVTGWTWPTDHAARKNPETGKVEAFRYQDYIKAFPIKTTVSTGSGSGSAGKAAVKPGKEQEFLAAAAQGYFSGNYAAAARKVVDDFVEVK